MMYLGIGRKQNGNNKRILLMIAMAVFIVAAVFQYTHSTREHLKEQAYYAVQQNVGAIANEIEASIGFAKSSIRLTSQSATQSMTGDVIEDVHAAKTAGMNDHIAKPLDLNTLAKILKKWV